MPFREVPPTQAQPRCATLVGHSITGKIQEGLERSDFIAVLLTANSIRSGWVEKEWQSRIDREVRMRSVEILPLKADDCEIPPLLRDKKWADFTDYEVGLARSWTRCRTTAVKSQMVAEHVRARRSNLDDDGRIAKRRRLYQTGNR